MVSRNRPFGINTIYGCKSMVKIQNLPFNIGPTAHTVNPMDLPSCLDFTLYFDPDVYALRQLPSPELEAALSRAYEIGQLFGTPLADDSYGKPYADDFLSFVGEFVAPHGYACEIGAGVGYVSRRLIDSGWEVRSLEPGKGYAPFWERYKVDIIQELFPSERAKGPFDLICAYGVLEHISNFAQFLTQVRQHLTSDGTAVFSVPDCTEEIIAGDPSILLHEHFTYFNSETLMAVLSQAGFEAVVRSSRYGRCLYAAAKISKEGSGQIQERCDLELLESYPGRAMGFISTVRMQLSELSKDGVLGVYCPGRALAVLDPAMPMRFFDDDPAQRGKFFPPFFVPIESRDSLLEFPVHAVVVMSRTFGDRIKTNLLRHGYNGMVLTVEDLFT